MVATNKEVLDRYLRPKIQELFSQLAEGQQRKFKRLFGSVEKMDADKIPGAIAICERAVKLNARAALAKGDKLSVARMAGESK